MILFAMKAIQTLWKKGLLTARSMPAVGAIPPRPARAEKYGEPVLILWYLLFAASLSLFAPAGMIRMDTLACNSSSRAMEMFDVRFAISHDAF